VLLLLAVDVYHLVFLPFIYAFIEGTPRLTHGKETKFLKQRSSTAYATPLFSFELSGTQDSALPLFMSFSSALSFSCSLSHPEASGMRNVKVMLALCGPTIKLTWHEPGIRISTLF